MVYSRKTMYPIECSLRNIKNRKNIRNGKDLHLNQSRDNYGDKSIKVTGPKLYTGNINSAIIKDSKTDHI